MVDPVQELAHDHRELSELLLALHDALSRIERGKSKLDDEVHELRDGIEALRDSLLDHFGREQESLLPFVVERLPNTAERADQLTVDHDRLAAMLMQLVSELSAVEAGEPIDRWRSSLSHFEELYAAHTKTELAFLREVVRSLAGDEAATEQLRTLLAAP